MLGIQCLGVFSVIIWVVVTMGIIFNLINRTIGLRVSAREEIEGLDATEHGLESAYADFMPSSVLTNYVDYEEKEEKNTSIESTAPIERTNRKTEIHTDSGMKLTKIEIVTKQAKFEALKTAMNNIGVTGMTVTQVLGCGMQKGATEYYRGIPVEMQLLPKIQVEIVVAKVPIEKVVEAAKKVLYTGHIGDGKIFIYDVEDVVKVRTGETGVEALQGEE